MVFPDSFAGKKVSIIGLGRSGVALARVLGGLGCRLLLSDSRDEAALAEVKRDLEGLDYELESGGQSSRVYEGRDLVVISPGVSVHHPLLKRAMESGVPVAGEVEIAARLSHLPFVAVTGTNGKSTTVTLLGAMLGRQGLVAGNIGNPLVAEVVDPPDSVEWIVAEISSFQLETVHAFAPRIAVLTNLTPDHLDRHPTFAEYVAAKARLFARQGPQDLAVFCYDDPVCRRLAEQLRSGRLPPWLAPFPPPPREGPGPRIRWFSCRGPVADGLALEEGMVTVYKEGKGEPLLAWDFPNLPGPHNLANALAALTVGLELGLPVEQMRAALAGHQSLHFRMELAGECQGVRYVNDSKATNVASVVAALEAFPPPLVLIAGGKDKGVDFGPLALAALERVEHLVLLGEAAERMGEAARRAGCASVHRVGSLGEAVDVSRRLACPGATVLLSPACSSFDMFASAEDRGAQFDALVKKVCQNGSEVSV